MTYPVRVGNDLWLSFFTPHLGLPYLFISVFSHPRTSQWHQNNLALSTWPRDDQSSGLLHPRKFFARLLSGSFWICLVSPTSIALRKRWAFIFLLTVYTSKRHEQDPISRPNKKKSETAFYRKLHRNIQVSQKVGATGVTFVFHTPPPTSRQS